MVDGDCGSVVYMFRENESSQDYIIGMFFGTLRSNPRIHQAVVVSKALKQFEATSEFQLEGLLPLHSAKEPPNRYHDSGYRSSRESSCIALADMNQKFQEF